MPGTPTLRNLVAALSATVALLGGAVVIVVWHASDGAPPVRVAAVSDVLPEVTTTSSSTTTSTSTTSTSTTSTSTTSTTVKPRPTTTTTVRKVAPATTAPTTPPVTSAPAASAEERCAAARQWVEAQGLVLPAGWGFRCPGKAVVDGTDRWGVACWNCQGQGSWIAVDIDRIGPSEATLRYVIAHETCHSIDDTTLGITTEIGADLCAALHGAPRPA